MKKTNLLWIILVLTITVAAFASAEETSLGLGDTLIEYTPYREAVLNDPGVIYKIKITNTGNYDRTYTITPDSNVIGEIGSYRLDPNSRIKVNSGNSETAYLYLSVEKNFGSRKSIPVSINSGISSANIELVVRQVGPFKDESQAQSMTVGRNNFLMILLFVLLAIILLFVIIALLGKKKKKKDDEEVQTYY